MEDKRKRILTMLENGTITTEEALTLLENLSDPKAETKEVQRKIEETEASEAKNTKSYEKETEEKTTDKNRKDPSEENGRSESTMKDEPPMDEFLEDLRKDFSNVGERFMQFMQSAVQKVKEFEFDAPFGQSLTFSETITKEADAIEEIIFDIDHGKVAIYSEEGTEVRAVFSVKAYNQESEAQAKETFSEKVLFVKDGEKLRLISDLKMMQVNVDLYVPKNEYKKISARLLNGAFNMEAIDVEEIYVKTGNGKIDVSKLVGEKASFETGNGAIRLAEVKGTSVHAETLNGRVYIDGHLKEVEAQSLNGHVVVTTRDPEAKKIEAKTVSGSAEMYIPSNVSLVGEISSNIGKLELQLTDVNQTSEQEQLLQRTIRFKKEEEGSPSTLYLFGEAKTGNVYVYYNASQA